MSETTDEPTPPEPVVRPEERTAEERALAAERASARNAVRKADRRARRVFASLLLGPVTLLGAIGGLVAWRSAHRSAPLAALAPPSGPLVTWLPRPITVIDTDEATAAPLIDNLRAAGLGTEFVSARTFASDAARAASVLDGSAAVWFTNRAATNLGFQRIIDAAEREVPILLDGDSIAARSLLHLSQQAKAARTITDHGVDVFLDVPTTGLVPGVPVETLARAASGAPVLVRSGSVLWSAVRLDEGKGLDRLPYLASTLEEQFGVQPRVERNDIDLYVDPDLVGSSTPKDLAKRWAAAGVQRIYLAAWKDDLQIGAHFDYLSFIETMHRQSIEVDAWLEWPHVNRSFWNLHPECRERTADGGYARVYWREHVAVELPHCFDLAWADTSALLRSAPFDGVNLGELYFEGASTGPSEPSTYTPFHPDIVKQFVRAHGFDPHELVDPKSSRYWKSDPASLRTWSQFRDELITDLHRKTVERLSTLFPADRVMVTVIDDRYLPQGEPYRAPGSLASNIGSDSRKILALRAEQPFVVQVEDPFTQWVGPPDRFREFAKLYDEVDASSLVLDVNVVERPTALDHGLTTKKSVGFELARSIDAIGSTGARLAVYASSSIRNEDLVRIRFSLAAGSTTLTPSASDDRVLETDALVPFRLRLSHPAHSVILDGTAQVLAEPTDLISVPAGKHTLSFG